MSDDEPDDYDERAAALRADLEAMRRDTIKRTETIEKMRQQIETLIAQLDAAAKRPRDKPH